MYSFLKYSRRKTTRMISRKREVHFRILYSQYMYRELTVEVVAEDFNLCSDLKFKS